MSSEIIDIKASVNSYDGCYGPKNCNGRTIFSTMKFGKCPKELVHGEGMLKYKEIIFVVDLSSSMEPVIHLLNSSIKSFRDVLIGEIKDDEETSILNKKHQELTSNFNFTVIGYNNRAIKIYPSEKKDLYLDLLLDERLVSKGLTNLGEGIKLAYSLKDPEKCTWIVIMTDGFPNEGAYISNESFLGLRDEAPKNTRIITLGYGQKFNSDLLMMLGEFTYIENKEQIPIVFGSIANEFKYAWGFNATINLVKTGFKMKYIVGCPRFGSIYRDREFIAAFALSDPSKKEELEKWIENKGKILLKFTSIKNMKGLEFFFPVEKLDIPPHETFREKYYSSAKGRRMKKLYNCTKYASKNSSLVSKICEEIRLDVDNWEEKCSIPHKKEILSFINKIEDMIENKVPSSDYQVVGYETGYKSVVCSTQTSSDVSSEYTPDSQKGIINEFLDFISKYNPFETKTDIVEK